MISDLWFSGFGAALGYNAQYQTRNWYDGGLQNQMASSCNSQNAQALSGYLQNSIYMPATPAPQSKGDCEGCGAPLKAYIHHCEYCRRES